VGLLPGDHLVLVHDRHRRLEGRGLEVLPGEEAVDVEGRPLSLADGVDDERRPGHDVAPGEDVGRRGLERLRVDLDRPVLVQIQPPLERRRFGVQTDGDHDMIHGGPKLTALDRNRPPPAAGVGLSELHPYALHLGDLALPADEPDGSAQVLEFDPFLLGRPDLPIEGGHFGPGPPVLDDDLASAEPGGQPGHVQADVAPPHEEDRLPGEVHVLPEVGPLQVGHAGVDVGQVLALDAHGHGLGRAQGEEDRLVALVAERLEIVDLDARFDLDAQGGDLLDVLPDDVLGQAEGGDGGQEHSARLPFLLEDGDPVTLPGQEIGRGQAGRSPAHDGDPLGLLLRRGDGPGVGMILEVGVGDEPLDPADGQGALQHAPGAFPLAGRIASPP
jgi:hypothetical protein